MNGMTELRTFRDKPNSTFALLVGDNGDSPPLFSRSLLEIRLTREQFRAAKPFSRDCAGAGIAQRANFADRVLIQTYRFLLEELLSGTDVTDA